MAAPQVARATIAEPGAAERSTIAHAAKRSDAVAEMNGAGGVRRIATTKATNITKYTSPAPTMGVAEPTNPLLSTHHNGLPVRRLATETKP